MNLRNRIKVNVEDQTSNDIYSNITPDSPAVYVIGFMGNNDSGEYFKPTYCDTISDFETYFGDEPRQYAADLEYVKNVSGTDVQLFDSEAFEYFVDSQGHMWSNNKVATTGNDEYGYSYAKRILQAGLPVLYEAVKSEYDSEGNILEPENVYDYMAGTFYDSESAETLISPFAISSNPDQQGSLANVNEYDVMFITTGGYPTLQCTKGGSNSISSKMIEVAEYRGDCVALLDHTNYPERPFITTSSKGMIKRGTDSSTSEMTLTNNLVASNLSETTSRAAIFTPWGTYGTSTMELPASFGYLTKYASTISNGASWLAVAGVNRAVISGFTPNTNKILTNNVADVFSYTNHPINAITNIHGYGQTIYGNSTIYSPYGSLKASQKLNVSILVSLVIKEARRLAFKYLFEQNTDSLFFNFKSDLQVLLDKMTSGSGLSSYKIIKQPSTEKDKLIVIIKLYTIYAIEAIEINVALNDTDVEIS